MKLLVLLLLFPGCALARFSETPEGQPVYVLGNPTCILGCASNLGTIRGGPGSPGDLSLDQDANAKAGVMAR
jgi:hypothetical protein